VEHHDELSNVAEALLRCVSVVVGTVEPRDERNTT
jgi:hypothetical protein